MTTVIITVLTYALIKLIKYKEDRAYQDGYEAYREELERESEEVYRKIKGE